MQCLLSQILSILWILSVTTEVWNFQTKTSRTYNSFKHREYWNPILFLVDTNFCIWSFWNKDKAFLEVFLKLLHISCKIGIRLMPRRRQLWATKKWWQILYFSDQFHRFWVFRILGKIFGFRKLFTLFRLFSDHLKYVSAVFC